jgi:hypothetical protein
MAKLPRRYCARCGKEFAAGAIMFMIESRTRNYRLFAVPGFAGVPVYQTKMFPVCEACLNRDERKEWKYKGVVTHSLIVSRGICGGCDRPLMAWEETWPNGRHCSNACAQIARCREQREEPPSVTCSVCSKQFQPTRSDAQFCSSACRQRAYRRRARTQNAR